MFRHKKKCIGVLGVSGVGVTLLLSSRKMRENLLNPFSPEVVWKVEKKDVTSALSVGGFSGLATYVFLRQAFPAEELQHISFLEKHFYYVPPRAELKKYFRLKEDPILKFRAGEHAKENVSLKKLENEAGNISDDENISIFGMPYEFKFFEKFIDGFLRKKGSVIVKNFMWNILTNILKKTPMCRKF